MSVMTNWFMSTIRQIFLNQLSIHFKIENELIEKKINFWKNETKLCEFMSIKKRLVFEKKNAMFQSNSKIRKRSDFVKYESNFRHENEWRDIWISSRKYLKCRRFKNELRRKINSKGFLRRNRFRNVCFFVFFDWTLKIHWHLNELIF